MSVNLNQLEVSLWLPNNVNCCTTEVVSVYIHKNAF